VSLPRLIGCPFTSVALCLALSLVCSAWLTVMYVRAPGTSLNCTFTADPFTIRSRECCFVPCSVLLCVCDWCSACVTHCHLVYSAWLTVMYVSAPGTSLNSTSLRLIVARFIRCRSVCALLCAALRVWLMSACVTDCHLVYSAWLTVMYVSAPGTSLNSTSLRLIAPRFIRCRSVHDPFTWVLLSALLCAILCGFSEELCLHVSVCLSDDRLRAGIHYPVSNSLSMSVCVLSDSDSLPCLKLSQSVCRTLFLGVFLSSDVVHEKTSRRRRKRSWEVGL